MPEVQAPDVARLEQKIDQLGQAKEERIKKSDDAVATEKRVNESLRRRLVAAEQLITSASKKVRSMSEELAQSKRLVQAGIRRSRKERRHRINLSKKYEASQKLLAEATTKLERSKAVELESYRRTLALRTGKPKEAYDLLRKENTIEGMNNTYKSFRRMVEGKKPADQQSRRPAVSRTEGKLPTKEVVEKKNNPAADVKAPVSEAISQTKSLMARMYRPARPGSVR